MSKTCYDEDSGMCSCCHAKINDIKKFHAYCAKCLRVYCVDCTVCGDDQFYGIPDTWGINHFPDGCDECSMSPGEISAIIQKVCGISTIPEWVLRLPNEFRTILKFYDGCHARYYKFMEELYTHGLFYKFDLELLTSYIAHIWPTELFDQFKKATEGKQRDILEKYAETHWYKQPRKRDGSLY